MSGIVGSKLNIRGSGRIAKLGTDGQVLTSAGAGLQANYEDAAGGGKIGQVFTVQNTGVESSSGTGWETITDLSVDITPAATSSKIWISSTLAYGVAMSTHVRLMRDTTAIGIGDLVGNHPQESFSTNENEMQYGCWPLTYNWLDSPSSTSAITYSWQWITASGTAYIGRSWYDNNTTNYGRGASSVTVMEVLA